MKKTNRTAINLEHILELIAKQKVIKTRNGKMYLSNKPRIRKDRVPTKNQKMAQEKFKRCSIYAQRANRDEDTRKKYKAMAAENQSAYNVAFRDAYHSPEVKSIITDGYQGRVGDIVIIEAIDDFKVISVKVEIYDAKNKLLENGDAVIDPEGSNWIYYLEKENGNVDGFKIKAIAFDIPGNEGTMEIIL